MLGQETQAVLSPITIWASRYAFFKYDLRTHSFNISQILIILVRQNLLRSIRPRHSQVKQLQHIYSQPGLHQGAPSLGSVRGHPARAPSGGTQPGLRPGAPSPGSVQAALLGPAPCLCLAAPRLVPPPWLMAISQCWWFSPLSSLCTSAPCCERVRGQDPALLCISLPLAWHAPGPERRQGTKCRRVISPRLRAWVCPPSCLEPCPDPHSAPPPALPTCQDPPTPGAPPTSNLPVQAHLHPLGQGSLKSALKGQRANVCLCGLGVLWGNYPLAL